MGDIIEKGSIKAVQDNYKKQAAAKAVTLIKDQSIVGLGAGSTIAFVVEFLKPEIENGLNIQLLTSSEETRRLLKQNKIDVSETNSFAGIDIYLDSCDQFDKDLNALKSGGGIHTQEKLLACMAGEFVLVCDEAKYTEKLETRFPLVIEMIPESVNFVHSQIQNFFPGIRTLLRKKENRAEPVITVNGNYLLDCWFSEWPELSGINPLIKTIAGVVETSLFYNIAVKAILSGENGTRTLEKRKK